MITIKIKDLKGKKFNKLLVLHVDEEKTNDKYVYWKCQCDCGSKPVSINQNKLNNNKWATKSCGCLKINNRSLDLIGQKFGRLTVIRRGEKDKTGHSRWWCQCDCGSEEKLIYQDALIGGKTVSCGCYLREINREKGKTLNKKYNNYDLTSKEYGIGFCHNTNREFYFDLEDYDKIKDYCWREDNNGYIITNEPDTRNILLLHRMVFDLSSDDNRDVDHIYHQLYDNRKNMLRIVKHADNIKNQKLSITNTSGKTGVSWDKRENSYEAYITVSRKRIHLGFYNNLEDAIRVRLEAEEKYFGEFQYKEFPPDESKHT